MARVLRASGEWKPPSKGSLAWGFGLCVVLFLSGCGAQRMSGPLPPPLDVQRAPVPIPASTEAGEIRSEIKASSNQTQNSITGIGANLGKLSETIQGFGGDLANVHAALRLSVDTQLEMKNRLDAAVQAQVGLKNDLEQLTVSTRAGRDAIVTTTEFSREMRDTLVYSFLATYAGTVAAFVALVAIVTKFLEASRRRAEERAWDAQQALKHHLKVTPIQGDQK